MAKINIALGAAVAAAAGFVAGILTAPKSGKETISEIKGAGVKAKGDVIKNATEAKGVATKKGVELKHKAEDVAHDVTSKAEELKGRVEQAVEGAQKGFSKKPKTTSKK